MAGKPKNTDALVVALASGLGLAAAARQAGASERTARRRLAVPAFRARVDAARTGLVGEAVGRLALIGGAAALKLHELLGAKSEAVRLGACRAVLEHMFRGVEMDALARQVEELAAKVEELTKCRDPRRSAWSA
jgi:hypothetical protein